MYFFPVNLVWLWSKLVESNVAPKFHEPSTGPYKVTKKLVNVTYEIHDEANNKTKIVYFKCLNIATLSPVKFNHSNNKSDHPSENDSDAAFEIVIPQRRNVPQKLAAPDVALQAQLKATAAPKVKPNPPHTENGAGPIQPIVEVRQAAEAAPVIAKPARSVPAADKQAAAPTAFLHVQQTGNNLVATARRRLQRLAQSPSRFYYCCFSQL